MKALDPSWVVMAIFVPLNILSPATGMLGFNLMKTAFVSIRGFEAMHALNKGQAELWRLSARWMRRSPAFRARFWTRAIHPDRDDATSGNDPGSKRSAPATYHLSDPLAFPLLSQFLQK